MLDGTLDIGRQFYEWGVKFGKGPADAPASTPAAATAAAAAAESAAAVATGDQRQDPSLPALGSAGSGFGGGAIDLPEGSGVSSAEAEAYIRSRVMPIAGRAARLRKVIELGQVRSGAFIIKKILHNY